MIFRGCNVSSVKADLAKGEITIGITVHMNTETLNLANDLGSNYAGKESPDVDVEIDPHDLPLFDYAKNQDQEPSPDELPFSDSEDTATGDQESENGDQEKPEEVTEELKAPVDAEVA
jgi:hypothetical protein